MTRRERVATLIIGLGLILMLMAAFDHAMRADKARLCASDATAYEGCDR